MSWIDGLGFCASLAVLASFCMTTIVALTSLALASNVLFCVYGLLAHIYPVSPAHGAVSDQCGEALAPSILQGGRRDAFVRSAAATTC
jgi:hypothetical protein